MKESNDGPWEGATYKLRTPHEDSAVYFTISGWPIEGMFVNSRKLESFQWITSAMTSYTKRIKDGVPVDTVIKEMSETFDPGGAYIVGRDRMNGLVHHLGTILDKYVTMMILKHGVPD